MPGYPKFIPYYLQTKAADPQSVSATYKIELDSLRTGEYLSAIDDITAYVETKNWQNGMMAWDEEVAQPARLILTLNNITGVFNQDGLGSELVTNGSFAAWGGSDDPTGWTVTGESGADPEVNEVGSGQSHGGAGTGAANLYTTSAALSISQTLLTAGQRYSVSLDVDTVVGTGGVVVKNGSTQVSPVYHVAGQKTLTFTAVATTLVIATDGAADVTIDNVSCKLASLYYGALAKGTLIRILTTAPLHLQLYVGKIVDVQLNAGSVTKAVVVITCDDAMLQMLDAEYAAEIQTDATVDEALAPIFDEAKVPFPYAHRYWMLEVEGASELGTTTKLYDHAITAFDTGATTIPYVGDNLDRGNGTRVQGFIRDMIAAEAGGRFFWGSRNMKFTFHNRHRDILKDAVDASFTQDDFIETGTRYLYADDLANEVTIQFEPRQVGSALTVLWTATNVPFVLKSKGPKVIIGRYQDVTNKNARVGALVVATFTRGTDYIANSASDGSGGDKSRKVAASIETGAGSSKITLTNTQRTDIYITTLQIRGTPLKTFDRQLVSSRDGESQFENEIRPLNKDIPAIASDEFAQEYADWLVRKYKNPMARLRAVTLKGNGTAARLKQCLLRTVGDKITITESATGHDRDYIIVGELHDVKAGGDKTHMTTWVLKPADRETYWVLEIPGKTELDRTTRLVL